MGNYKNETHYVTPVLIDYGHKRFYAEVRNNLQFNSPTHEITNFGGDKIIESNNLYYANAFDILKDTIHVYLKEKSPAIDSGYTFPYINADIEGIIRPQGSAYDVGARESLPVSGIVKGRRSSEIPGHPWIFLLLVITAFLILIGIKLNSSSASEKAVSH